MIYRLIDFLIHAIAALGLGLICLALVYAMCFLSVRIVKLLRNNSTRTST